MADTIKEMLAGGAGGACLVFVGHPLDTIKVRIQTMVVVPGQPPPFSGALDCALKAVRHEGPLALYRGMLAPLLSVTPMYALCFLGYGEGKKIFCKEDTYTNLTAENLFRIALAGATSGFFTTPILAPMERLKCSLQIQNLSKDPNIKKFAGPGELAKHILKTEGFAGLNRGYFATNLRDSLASMAYFSTYAWLRAVLLPADKTGTFSKTQTVCYTLFAGGMAGIANWLPAIPVDTLKSRLQTAPPGTYPNGIRSVAMEIIRTEPNLLNTFKTMYRGFGAVMLRAFPANAACFLGYETARSWLDQVYPTK